MTKVIAQTVSNMHLYRERLFAVFAAMLLLLALSYGWLMHSTIVNVVESEKMLKGSRILASRVQDLESKYLSLQNSVTLKVAYEKGYKDAETTHFISKKTLGKALTFGNEL